MSIIIAYLKEFWVESSLMFCIPLNPNFHKKETCSIFIGYALISKRISFKSGSYVTITYKRKMKHL